MNLAETEKLVNSLLDTFVLSGNVSIDLRNKGLKKEIKSDNTPVSNGDIEVNKILTKKRVMEEPELNWIWDKKYIEKFIEKNLQGAAPDDYSHLNGACNRILEDTDSNLVYSLRAISRFLIENDDRKGLDSDIF